MTNQQLIKKLKLNYVNSDIAEENFPYLESNAKVELFNAGKTVTSEEAISLMKEKGLRPATLTELLQFAIENEKEVFNDNYYVTALGSVWQDRGGDRGVPCLAGWDDKRELGLFWFEDDWRAYCRFAAVRVSSDPLIPCAPNSLIFGHLEKIKSEIAEIEKILNTNK